VVAAASSAVPGVARVAGVASVLATMHDVPAASWLMAARLGITLARQEQVAFVSISVPEGWPAALAPMLADPVRNPQCGQNGEVDHNAYGTEQRPSSPLVRNFSVDACPAGLQKADSGATGLW
jgi:hypothetical protein